MSSLQKPFRVGVEITQEKWYHHKPFIINEWMKRGKIDFIITKVVCSWFSFYVNLITIEAKGSVESKYLVWDCVGVKRHTTTSEKGEAKNLNSEGIEAKPDVTRNEIWSDSVKDPLTLSHSRTSFRVNRSKVIDFCLGKIVKRKLFSNRKNFNKIPFQKPLKS